MREDRFGACSEGTEVNDWERESCAGHLDVFLCVTG